jgi:triosephosphate isomerase
MMTAARSQQKFVFGNWKMAQSRNGVESFLSSWSNKPASAIAGVFPSFVHLDLAVNQVRQLKLNLVLGAQDCSTEPDGAFTGEVSAQQIRDSGCEFVLIGHSERRQRFQESSQSLSARLAQALRVGLQPVFCIGETEAQRLEGKTNQILISQLEVIKASASKVIVAYEPVWAIGTGRVASVQDVHAAHALIRSECPLLRAVIYGGSVKPDNSKDLAQIQGVDGFLVGGASLEVGSFEKILQSVL